MSWTGRKPVGVRCGSITFLRHPLPSNLDKGCVLNDKRRRGCEESDGKIRRVKGAVVLAGEYEACERWEGGEGERAAKEREGGEG
jgi:hypothetical protein